MNYESTRTVKLLTLLTDKLDPGQASQTNHKIHQVYSNQFCRLQLHFDTTLPSLHHSKTPQVCPNKKYDRNPTAKEQFPYELLRTFSEVKTF